MSVIVKTRRTLPRAQALGLHVKLHAAAFGELHRIVDQILDRRAQPHRVALEQLGNIVGDRHRRAQPFGFRTRGQRIRQRRDQPPRPENFLAELERAGIGLGGVDHQRGERGEMLGAVLDLERPSPLAFAEIGARQQFAKRQNSRERGADVVRVGNERRFGGARAKAPAHAASFGAATASRRIFFSISVAPWRPPGRRTFMARSG